MQAYVYLTSLKLLNLCADWFTTLIFSLKHSPNVAYLGSALVASKVQEKDLSSNIEI